VTTIEEILKMMSELAIDLKKKSDKEFASYEEKKQTAIKAILQLQGIRDDSKTDDATRSIAAEFNRLENLNLAGLIRYTTISNDLVRISLLLEIFSKTIVSELRQSEQPTTQVSEQNLTKISELEKQLTQLDKEFHKYSPTLRKFKRALDQTEKTLRENR